MSLVKCPDCGNDLSTSATACPRCGRPTAAGERFFARHKVLASAIRIILMLLAIFVALFAIGRCGVVRL